MTSEREDYGELKRLRRESRPSIPETRFDFGDLVEQRQRFVRRRAAVLGVAMFGVLAGGAAVVVAQQHSSSDEVVVADEGGAPQSEDLTAPPTSNLRPPPTTDVTTPPTSPDGSPGPALPAPSERPTPDPALNILGSWTSDVESDVGEPNSIELRIHEFGPTVALTVFVNDCTVAGGEFSAENRELRFIELYEVPAGLCPALERGATAVRPVVECILEGCPYALDGHLKLTLLDASTIRFDQSLNLTE